MKFAIERMIIAGDLNKNIESNIIQGFIIEHRLVEVHTFISGKYEISRDNRYINGSKCINTVLATTGLIELLDRYRLTDFNNILFTDHRRYIVYIVLEDYFNTSRNYINKLEVNQLNS